MLVVSKHNAAIPGMLRNRFQSQSATSRLHVARDVSKQVMYCAYISAFCIHRTTSQSLQTAKKHNMQFTKLFYLLFRLGSTNIREKGVGLKVRFAHTRVRTLAAAHHSTIFNSSASFFLFFWSRSLLTYREDTFTKQENSPNYSSKGNAGDLRGVEDVARGKRGTSILMT